MQLAHVGDPGEAGERWAPIDHLLSGCGSSRVAAELDFRVDDDAEGVGRCRLEAVGPLAYREGQGEVVASQGEEAAARERPRVVRRQRLCVLQGLGRLGVPRRIGGGTRLVEVGDAEVGEKAGAFTAHPDLLL